jgi:hypothetical protein
MTLQKKLKFAWKYRNYLWKYRKLLRHRKAIAGAMMAAGVGTAAWFAMRGTAAGHPASNG